LFARPGTSGTSYPVWGLGKDYTMTFIVAWRPGAPPHIQDAMPLEPRLGLGWSSRGLGQAWHDTVIRQMEVDDYAESLYRFQNV